MHTTNNATIIPLRSASHSHALVFVDHHEARVILPGGESPDGGHVVIHRQDKTKDGHHHDMDRHDLDAIAAKLAGTAEILIAGPSTAKLELHRFLREHHPEVAARVVEIDTLDAATQGELKNFARDAFKRIDLWR